MNPFDLLSKWFWLLSIILAFQYLYTPQKMRENFETDEDFMEFRSIRRRIFIFSIIPWMVMGVGILYGGVSDIWQYFPSRESSLYVSVFYLVVFVELAFFTIWVLFMGGAKPAAKYQLVSVRALGRPIHLSEGKIKIVTVLVFLVWTYFSIPHLANALIAH